VLSDRVRGDEYDFTTEAMDALQSVPWAAPLLRAAQTRDLLKAEDKPLMFEVRFAFELHRAGMIAEYEYPTGVGGSSVDFRVLGVTFRIMWPSFRVMCHLSLLPLDGTNHQALPCRFHDLPRHLRQGIDFH
jgi:hypothetical protein